MRIRDAFLTLIGRSPTEERIEQALEIAKWGMLHKTQNKQWVIDQIVRILTRCPRKVVGSAGPYEYSTFGESQAYKEWVESVEFRESDGEYMGSWDIGAAP